MSLTSFINTPEVKNKFAETFDYPILDGMPELLCPPQTNHYSLIGTAFDYLLRFNIEAQNNKAKTKQWVAEEAVELTKGSKDFKLCSSVLKEAKESYSLYIKTKILDDRVLKAALLLAQLDPIYRAGFIDPNIGQINKLDIDDMRNLIKATDLSIFKSKKVCLLNPTFGKGSMLVGGADADLVIDDTIIDIKTVKNFKLDKSYYNQLIGYYILSTIGGIDGYTTKPKINNMAIYYSRYAKFVNFKVSDVMKSVDVDKFILWFKKKAKE